LLPVQSVRKFDVFIGCSQQFIEKTSGDLEEIELRKGQICYSQGELAAFIYWVVIGHIKTFRTHSVGKEIALSTLTDGAVFGEADIFPPFIHTTTAVAIEDSIVTRLEMSAFKDSVLKNPQCAQNFIQTLCARTQRHQESIEALAHEDVFGRVARYLLSQCEEVNGELVTVRLITKKEIADAIGASREMVSRVMSDFTRRGYIASDKKRVRFIRPGLVVKKAR